MYLWWRCNSSPLSSSARHPIFLKNAQNSPISGWNPLKTDHKRHQNRDKIPLRSSNRWRNRWVVFRHFCPKPITNFLVIDYYSLIFEQNQSQLLEKYETSRWYTSVPCRRDSRFVVPPLQAVYFAVHLYYLSTTIKKNRHMQKERKMALRKL